MGVRAGGSLLVPVKGLFMPTAKKDHLLTMHAKSPCTVPVQALDNQIFGQGLSVQDKMMHQE